MNSNVAAAEPAMTLGIHIVSLQLRKLRAIQCLDLPADGLGWNTAIPAICLVGGPNGSGKTTLFDFIACVFEFLSADRPPGFQDQLTNMDLDAYLDFELRVSPTEVYGIRYLQGSDKYIAQNKTDNCFGLSRHADGLKPFLEGHSTAQCQHKLRSRAEWERLYGPSPFSGNILYFPSSERDVVIPAEEYKAPGRLPETREFVQRWRPPSAWKDSLEALLYSLRWEDLNAKEEGRAPGAFNAYAAEFAAFTHGSKTLKWFQSELWVELGNGDRHSLTQLSSGEKQVLLLTAELRRRWRPGSLVLIDEPELHLHDAWQTLLYERILALQRERGGQAWLATQSGHLFKVADSNTKLLLTGTGPWHP